jgi:predicted rRNA methylase YqxC with S4 and FtsJ domains
VLFNKLCRKKFDHFIHYKYKLVKKYYGEKCLDVGAGYGYFSHYLATKGHEIKAIDVTNKFQYNLDFQLFDGKHISLIRKVERNI